MKKIEEKLFLLILSLILLGGFSKPLFFPEESNYYENRPAYTMPKITIKNVMNKTFQDEFEKSLSDQLPLATRMKQVQKNVGLLTQVVYSATLNDGIAQIDSLLLKDNYLLYKTTNFEDIKSYIEAKTKNINEAVMNNKKTDFYLYYIEKDTDIDFATNKKSGISDYIADNISEEVTMGTFKINNFDQYSKYFYRTDHHWNYQGSYQAYKEICNMFGVEPMNYKEEVEFGRSWSGSKARQIGGDLLFREKFKAYKFDFKEHKTFINNVEVAEYGSTNAFFSNQRNDITYGYFYGDDKGLVEFDYSDNSKDNLLIIGESYDNAINELLASHFNKTYNIDLRAYKSELGKDFELSKFIKENDIDKVLLIGNKDYFVLETFMLYN